MSQEIAFRRPNKKSNYVALVPFDLPNQDKRIQSVVVISLNTQKAWVTFCNAHHHYPLNFDFSKKVTPLKLDGAKFQLAGMSEWTDLNELWTKHQATENRTCKSKELEKVEEKRNYTSPAVVAALLLIGSYGAYQWWNTPLDGMSLPGGPTICPRPSNP